MHGLHNIWKLLPFKEELCNIFVAKHYSFVYYFQTCNCKLWFNAAKNKMPPDKKKSMTSPNTKKPSPDVVS